MLKLILNDYRCRFFISFKLNIGMSALWYFIYIYVYMLLYFNLNVIKYSIGIIPMLLGLFLSRMYPNQLSKLLFLCPMSEQDRKKYLQTAYWLRISIPTVLWLTFASFALYWGVLSLFYYIVLSLLVFAFLLGINMYHVLLNMRIIIPKENYNHNLSFIYEILSVFLQLDAWITILYFASGFAPDSQAVILTIMTAIEILLSAAILIYCYKPVMKLGAKYESCYPIIIENTLNA